MTARETRLVGLGIAVGGLAVVLVVALLATHGEPGMLGQTRVVPILDTPPRPARTPPTHAQDTGTQPGTTVELSAAEVTAAGVQVADVRTATLKSDIDAFGRVEQPEAQLAAVSTRIAGRVDKLYLQYTGEKVKSGQPIADVYSPEVAAAIDEYRLAEDNLKGLRNSDDAFARAQADALAKASHRRLELWGISSNQIEATPTEGVPHVTVFASASGTVIERKVTQGQYVNAGDTLFTVANLSQVWIKADVYEEQLPLIRRGQLVNITGESLSNQTLHGQVDFIEPSANPQTRTVSVHVHVANPSMRLLPGMFVNTTFVRNAVQPSVVVPRSAVLDTGTRKLVYVAHSDGAYEAREVAVGAPSDDLFPVTRGLHTGEKIVLNGNFLIDSQAHLSTGLSGLYAGSKEFASSPRAQDTNVASASGAPPAAARIEIHSDPNPMKAGQDNTFQVKITGPDGKPVTDAGVTLALVMPAMPSMSMPEMRSTVPLALSSDGVTYTGKAQPGMSGTWNITVEARRKNDLIATSRIRLEAR